MKEEKHIIEALESLRPTLTQEARLSLWDSIKPKLNLSISRPIPFPYTFDFLTRRVVVSAVLIFALVLGGGGTAFASNAARPGDLLFPLDRALENARLRLALSDTARAALTENLTEERLRELREIIDESLVVSSTGLAERQKTSTSTNTSSTAQILEIEADIFTDTTVVKVELNDRKTYFETDADTRNGIIDAIHAQFSTLSLPMIDAALNLEIEDRTSRPKDRGVTSFTPNGEARVSVAVEEILSFLGSTDLNESHRRQVLTTLFSEVDDVTRDIKGRSEIRENDRDNRLEIRMDDDGDSRLEIRDGDSRIRIEEKDGEVRIKTQNSNSDDNSENDDRSSKDALSGDSFTSSFLEIEADIFTDTTVVKVELNDRKTYFETEANTRSAIVRAVHEKFPELGISEIDTRIDLEIEDRARKSKDVGQDDSDADSSGSGGDGDDDSSSSGSGGSDGDDSSGSGSGKDDDSSRSGGRDDN